jgi:hypothetical protein
LLRALPLLPVLLAGCNALLNRDFDGEPAPPLDGGTWVSGRAPSREWRVVTFFEPDSERSRANLPRLAALRTEGVALIAVTRAPVAEARRFGANCEVLADAGMAFERWGIGSVDHAPVYLIDPQDRVLAEGFEDCAEILRERLGPPAAPPE